MKVFGFRSRFRTMGNSVVPLPHHVPAGSDALQQNGQNGALGEHANQERYIGSGSGAAFLIAGAWSLSCVPIPCSQFITSWLLQRTPMLGRFNQRYCQTRWPFSWADASWDLAVKYAEAALASLAQKTGQTLFVSAPAIAGRVIPT